MAAYLGNILDSLVTTKDQNHDEAVVNKKSFISLLVIWLSAILISTILLTGFKEPAYRNKPLKEFSNQNLSVNTPEYQYPSNAIVFVKTNKKFVITRFAINPNLTPKNHNPESSHRNTTASSVIIHPLKKPLKKQKESFTIRRIDGW